MFLCGVFLGRRTTPTPAWADIVVGSSHVTKLAFSASFFMWRCFVSCQRYLLAYAHPAKWFPRRVVFFFRSVWLWLQNVLHCGLMTGNRKCSRFQGENHSWVPAFFFFVFLVRQLLFYLLRAGNVVLVCFVEKRSGKWNEAGCLLRLKGLSLGMCVNELIRVNKINMLAIIAR